MEYFNLLEFKKEPFSNSPEPEFLFGSSQHSVCLQMLELAIRLRRGLNIVIGEVGTGKTTLCRKLIQNLSEPAASASDAVAIDTCLMLDPAVESRLEFVRSVAAILGVGLAENEETEWQIKERIKHFLFEKGVNEQKILALIIDEGQKIPEDCLEILREFLNYETNHFKLLQIVIFAQPEFRKNLSARANLLDRVNFLHHLKPLSFAETKAMIDYRLCVASMKSDKHSILTPSGLLAVYLATSGYPRKVVSLCHHIMLKMIIRGKSKAGWFLVRSCMGKMKPSAPVSQVRWATLGILALVLAGLTAGLFFYLSPTGPKTQSRQMALSGINFQKPVAPLTNSQANSKSDEQIPESLGTIPLKKRMTIWRVFENIYGDSSMEIATTFKRANPGILNLDETVEGAVISVPAIKGQGYPLQSNPVLVSLESGSELAGIYYSFIAKNGDEKFPPIRFFSVWNKADGMRFDIVLDRSFTSKEDARQAIGQLPPELSASARILSEWKTGTVIFNRRVFKN